MTVKRYGPPAAADVDPIKLEVVVKRDDQPEVHAFQAKPVLSAGDMLAMLTGDDDPARLMKALARSISHSMDNTDGMVPAQWKPTELKRPAAPAPSPAAEWPPVAGGSVVPWPGEQPPPADDLPPSYRGPDGVIYPFSDAEKLAWFTDPVNGTSRRRWLHLIFQDDEVVLDLSVLVNLAKDLIAAASGRPTFGQP